MIILQGNGRCLDAFTVALGQASEGKWYASTMELQLASFEICVACRGVLTLRVTVEKNMPLSLWDDDGSLGDSLDDPEWRELPTLRAAGVAWKMPAGMFVPALWQSGLLSKVQWVQMSGFNWPYATTNAASIPRWGDLPLPLTRLPHSPGIFFEAMLTFLARKENGSKTFQRLEHGSWPPELRQLSLGCVWNGEDMDWEGLPSSLERLALGGRCNQSIESATWPVSLKRLTLGGMFNQRITDKAVWPASLLQLTFGCWFDQPITDAVWPASLKQLTFGESFDQSITDVAWPASLLRLNFGQDFNRPVNGVVWPSSLLMLAFGLEFNQPIADVVWPPCLQQLTFQGSFNQPITDVVWPASLDCFGCFSHPINNVSWPSALQWLTLGNGFYQPMEEVVWPTSLRWLAFEYGFNTRTDTVVWPASLEVIYDDGSSPPRDGDDWPPGKDMFDNPKDDLYRYF